MNTPKKLLLVFGFISSFIVVQMTALSTAPRSWAGQAEKNPSIQFQVKGMHCASCIRSIEKTFLSRPEVEQAKADLKTGNVIVTLKAGQSLTQEAAAETLKKADPEFTLSGFKAAL